MATEQNIGAIKLCGYLEKKGKMKVVTTWKKYWFVLEGRLLLYYRSQEEYENLSPCKGSINMGLAVNIRPGLAAAGILEIITRTNNITLRAKHRNIQEKWLQALMDACGGGGQPSVSSPVKMTHFRYSMDNLIPALTSAKVTCSRNKLKHNYSLFPKNIKQALTRQNTLPYRFNKTTRSDGKKTEMTEQLLLRFQQLGARTYGGSLDSIVKKKTSSQSHDEKNEENELYEVFTENTEYLASSDENKNCLIENDEDGAEYYCTYYEPELPPRRAAESDDEMTKKQSAFAKFARKFRSFTSMTKNSKNKKSCDEIQEPIYDTVNYFEINAAERVAESAAESVAESVTKIPVDIPQDNIVKTLLDLKQTLEEKKLKVKDIIESTSNSPPGLPPRTGSKTYPRSPSPFHDTPKNNSPVTPPSLDAILNDLNQENEELNVRQLIKKFNNNEDVHLRQKNTEEVEDVLINRYSEDLNKLLEELAKVTSAPLLTPGVTSSLIQMRGPPVTDEEWLAVTPIRRRRFSDPDYDVPRPHRSLQFLSPPLDTEKPEEAIPATRFFGPVLSPALNENWRSMTPDSLEPAVASRRPPHDPTKIGPDLGAFMDSLEPLSEASTAF